MFQKIHQPNALNFGLFETVVRPLLAVSALTHESGKLRVSGTAP
jgi:hypothetical protein